MPELQLEGLLVTEMQALEEPERPVSPSANRPFGLHMETTYILDCSVEFGAITPLEDLVFRVQNPASIALMNITDQGGSLPPHWLRNTARQYLDSLPLEERYVWALKGIQGMELGIRMLQERIEFMVQLKVQSDLGVAERDSVPWMTEGTPAVFAAKHFTSVHDVTQANVQSFVAAQYLEAKERLEEDLEFVHKAVAWVSLPGNRDHARAIALRLFQELPSLITDTSTGLVQVKWKEAKSIADQRKSKRTARSAIKKAFKLFCRTGLEDNVRMMVSGQEVELSHPESPFKFVLQPLQAGWLEQKTLAPGRHVPYQLTLLTKENVFLSRLCVLFDETPVLDQLLALTFFVQSGCEEEILLKANWFGYENAFEVRSILQEKAPALLDKVKAPIPGTGTNGLRFQSPKHRANELWEPYSGPVRNWIGNWMGDLMAAVPTQGLASIAIA